MLNFCSDAMRTQGSRAQGAGREVVGQMAEEKSDVLERRKYRKRERMIENPKIQRPRKGMKTYGGKAKRNKRRQEGGAEMRPEKSCPGLSEQRCHSGISVRRRWRVLNRLSARQHPALRGDKCHMPLLTLDKGSVHQRCQPRGPAGSIVTFIAAPPQRSPRISSISLLPLLRCFPSSQPACPAHLSAFWCSKKTPSS